MSHQKSCCLVCHMMVPSRSLLNDKHFKMKNKTKGVGGPGGGRGVRQRETHVTHGLWSRGQGASWAAAAQSAGSHGCEDGLRAACGQTFRRYKEDKDLGFQVGSDESTWRSH